MGGAARAPFLPFAPGKTLMNKPDNVTEKGKAAGASLRKAAKQEERKIEAQKGSDLRKGEKRFRGALEEFRRQERWRKTALGCRAAQ
jgi:hypothetical protein